MKDYYRILGVSPNADFETIKKAYKKLLRINHPDKHPNEPESMLKKYQDKTIELNEAYEVLSDETKRDIYDQQLSVRTSHESMSSRYSRNTQTNYFYEQRRREEQRRQEQRRQQEMNREFEREIHARKTINLLCSFEAELKSTYKILDRRIRMIKNSDDLENVIGTINKLFSEYDLRWQKFFIQEGLNEFDIFREDFTQFMSNTNILKFYLKNAYLSYFEQKNNYLNYDFTKIKGIEVEDGNYTFKRTGKFLKGKKLLRCSIVAVSGISILCFSLNGVNPVTIYNNVINPFFNHAIQDEYFKNVSLYYLISLTSFFANLKVFSNNNQEDKKKKIK